MPSSVDLPVDVMACIRTKTRGNKDAILHQSSAREHDVVDHVDDWRCDCGRYKLTRMFPTQWEILSAPDMRDLLTGTAAVSFGGVRARPYNNPHWRTEQTEKPKELAGYQITDALEREAGG